MTHNSHKALSAIRESENEETSNFHETFINSSINNKKIEQEKLYNITYDETTSTKFDLNLKSSHKEIEEGT